MPQQETERFSEAIHPLYHPANKPQSDFRDFSGAAASLSRAAGWVLGPGVLHVAGALSRNTTDHPPDNSPGSGALLWGLCLGRGLAGVETMPSLRPCLVPPERSRCKSQPSIFLKVLLSSTCSTLRRIAPS